MKTNILIISYYFAPIKKVGSLRFSFLSTFLDKYLSNTYILTAKSIKSLSKDRSLPFSGKIIRTLMVPPFPIKNNSIIGRIYNKIWINFLCLLDPFSGWLLPAFIAGIRLIKKNKISVIIVSGPPFSPVLLALLYKVLFKTKIIIDYRDPWSTHNWDAKSKYGNNFFKDLNSLLERATVQIADALVFCTETMMEQTLKRISKYNSASCFVVHSGYNHLDKIEPRYLEKNKTIIIYAGEFYGQRSLKVLAHPLKKLIQKGELIKENLRLHIFGKILPHDRIIFEKLGIDDLLKEHHPVEHYIMLRYLLGADILLLISGSDVGYAVPYKFYDYLSVRKPIFAIAPKESEIARLMSKIDCGNFASIGNNNEIEINLKEMLTKYKKYSFAGAENFTWKNAAKKYVNLINEQIGL